VDLAYVAMGIHVQGEAVKSITNLRKAKDGSIYVNSHQETSVRGLYAIGDCVKSLSQISVAVGHAAIAATHIHNRLSENENKI
jgi:thioredoxin reductase (NADPH)